MMLLAASATPMPTDSAVPDVQEIVDQMNSNASAEEKTSFLLEYLMAQREPLLNFGKTLLIALIVFLIGKRIIALLLKLLNRWMERSHVEVSVHKFIMSLGRVLLYILLIFCVAGMKPFLVGDYIVAGGVEGIVRNIDIFYTRIVTTDNKVIVIPNGTLSNGNIINTSQEEYRLLILDFMVGYDAQISKVREVVLNLMEKDEGVCKDRPQSVNIDKLNPGRVRLQAKAWVTNKEYWDVRYRMLEAIKEELPKQGISLF